MWTSTRVMGDRVMSGGGGVKANIGPKALKVFIHYEIEGGKHTQLTGLDWLTQLTIFSSSSNLLVLEPL